MDGILEKNVKFDLCGDGKQEVFDLIKTLDISHRIGHIGRIKENERDEYFKNSFVHILPSYREGLPMTILESMAYGIPNISTNIATIPEVMTDGVEGFLIQPGDRDKLKDRILELYYSKELRKKMSEASYQRVCDTFSTRGHLEHVQEIYYRLQGGNLKE